MKKLTLITKGLPNGTYGELFMNGERLCYTVEREWNNNNPSISCVPAGAYNLKRHESPRFGECFALEAPTLGVTVYGPSVRTHCLMHVANFPHQLEGCIAPGTALHSAKWGVANSKIAMNVLLETLIDDEYELEIVRL
ncbi:DUF5675 family protein [Vibrio sp. Sgm 5]|uniref:DUF5675 family protein n=1 Tax=Vibrio sp. Sgm 5 TaxID=2994387 RepID=UPI0022498BAE|nr:DUF5675 family protein [Vibrio sp. Sgm 5]MCX2788365.1 DUF5675 family protein [Vibrio sp. Sgm 5]